MNPQIHNSGEQQLIADIVAGNIALYHDLVRLYERDVFITCFSYMKNDKDAEDASQETFIKAFRNLQAFRGDSKFSTWLIAIARNEAKSRLRRGARLRMVPLEQWQGDNAAEPPAFLGSWREIPSAVVERHEIRRALEQAIRTLPEIYKEVFVLRKVQELNQNETAELLHLNSSIVKVRLHRARKMLQRILEPQLSGRQVTSRRVEGAGCGGSLH